VISSGTAFIFDTVTSAPNKRSLSNDARQTVPATFSVAPASGSPPRSGKAGSHDSTTGRGFHGPTVRDSHGDQHAGSGSAGRGDFDYTGGAVERPASSSTRWKTGSMATCGSTSTRSGCTRPTPRRTRSHRSASWCRSRRRTWRRSTSTTKRGSGVARGGAASSLAGQTVNEAVVLDLTGSMDEVLSTDPEAGGPPERRRGRTSATSTPRSSPTG